MNVDDLLGERWAQHTSPAPRMLNAVRCDGVLVVLGRTKDVAFIDLPVDAIDDDFVLQLRPRRVQDDVELRLHRTRRDQGTARYSVRVTVHSARCEALGTRWPIYELPGVGHEDRRAALFEFARKWCDANVPLGFHGG